MSEPLADIELLNAAGQVEVTHPDTTGALTLTVSPGRHRLQVSKPGFEDFSLAIEIRSGSTLPVSADLKALDERHVPTEPQTAPVLPANQKPLAFMAPSFELWVREVALLPADQQVNAVIKKMVELNPDFEGRLFDYNLEVPPKVENGVVESVGFVTDHVTDISPVRAFTQLKKLRCWGSGVGLGQLAHLSPLKGMPLTYLIVARNPLKEISPLTGMPLTRLLIYNTEISDLSPLRGMKLEIFHCRATPVTDLSPLSAMPLVAIDVSATRVADLSPLQGMPLSTLAVDFVPQRDTSLLRSTETLKSINGKSSIEFWNEYGTEERPDRNSP